MTPEQESDLSAIADGLYWKRGPHFNPLAVIAQVVLELAKRPVEPEYRLHSTATQPTVNWKWDSDRVRFETYAPVGSAYRRKCEEAMRESSLLDQLIECVQERGYGTRLARQNHARDLVLQLLSVLDTDDIPNCEVRPSFRARDHRRIIQAIRRGE